MTEPSPATIPMPPTVRDVRDRIDGLLTTPSWSSATGYAGQYGNRKRIGNDEIVIMHPSGKKYSVRVSEILG